MQIKNKYKIGQKVIIADDCASLGYQGVISVITDIKCKEDVIFYRLGGIGHIWLEDELASVTCENDVINYAERICGMNITVKK